MAKDFASEFSDHVDCHHHGTGPVEKSCPSSNEIAADYSDAGEKSLPPVNRVALQDVARGRAAELILRAFPAPTKRATAKEAAQWLGYSPEQVLNWINCKSSVPFDVIFAIGAKKGVFMVMEVMTMGGHGRGHFLNKIVQGVRRVIA